MPTPPEPADRAPVAPAARAPRPGADREAHRARRERRRAAERRATVRRRLLAGLASAVAVLAVVALAVVVSRSGGGADDPVRTAGRRSTAAPTTTSTPSTSVGTTATTPTTEPSTTTAGPSSTTAGTTTTAPAATVDPAVPVWPSTRADRRFDDPVAAARSFAVDLVGFGAPVLGSFRPVNDHAGSVAVRPAADGPVTRVLVRRLADGTWWVVASAADTITLDRPATGARVTCPLRLTGTALVFEGTVDASLRDDAGAEVGRGVVTGGDDVPRPFDGTIDCSLTRDGGARYGTVVLTEPSAEDGSVLQAAARRVAL